MENTDLTCCSSTRVGIVGDDSWESERSEIQTKPGVVILSQELSMNLGYSVDGFGSLNGAVGGWIPKQNDGKVIRLVKTFSKIAVRQGFNLFYIGTNSVQITSAYKEPRHLATLKSVRLIWQSLFNVAFRKAMFSNTEGRPWYRMYSLMIDDLMIYWVLSVLQL